MHSHPQDIAAIRPMQADAPLIVYIDFKSPYAYLAIEPTRQMLADLGLVADWRPFVLDIGSYLGSAKLDKKGKVATENRSKEQWSGVKYAYFDCRRYANLRGLTIRGTVKIWDTNLPAVAMLWVKQHESLAEQCAPDSLLERFLDAVYVPFWRRELDVEELEAMIEILQKIGAPTAGFAEFARSEDESGQGWLLNDKLQQQTFDAGVYGVPTFILPESAEQPQRKFFGREHLLRIAWHLQGELGAAPDVGYQELDNVSIEQLKASATGAPEGGRQDKQLRVFFDFKDPNSYLAMAPLLGARDEHDIVLQWHATLSSPLKRPASKSDAEDRSQRHRRIRGEYLVEDLQRYAPHPLADVHADIDTSVVMAALAWLGQTINASAALVDAFVQAVFLRFWREQQSISGLGDADAIMQQLRETDRLSEIDFAQWQQLARAPEEFDRLRSKAIDAALALAHEHGVFATPTMMLDHEPFQGRAQLPLVVARLNAGV